jgi:hypothetical protein
MYESSCEREINITPTRIQHKCNEIHFICEKLFVTFIVNGSNFSVGPKPLKRAPQKPKALQRAKAFGFKGL